MLYLASRILDKAKIKYDNVYTNARYEIASILKEYFRDSHDILRDQQWEHVLNRMVQILYMANTNAVDIVNAELANAYAEGYNTTLYGRESQLKHKTNVLPYTSAVVSSLVEAGVISLNIKSINKNKDRRWSRTRLRNVARKASTKINGLEYDNLALYLARSITNSIKKSMNNIAHVMVLGAYDDGIYKAGLEVQQSGINIDKTWLSIMDANVRDSHKHLNNTTIPINSSFQSFHGPIKFPHDPDAALEEICGCRCRMAVHLRGKIPHYSKDTLLPSEVLAYRHWRDARISELGGEVELIKRHLSGK